MIFQEIRLTKQSSVTFVSACIWFSRRHFYYRRPLHRAACFNDVGYGERIARTERACRPQLLFSIGFFLLNLRGETLEPSDWPFPRQTAQLRCTIIYLVSSRARHTLAIVSLLYHAAASPRRRWNEDGKRKSERSVWFNRSHRALSRKPLVRNCRYFFSSRPTIRDKSPRALRLTHRRGNYPTARKLIYFGDCAMYKPRDRRAKILTLFSNCLSVFLRCFAGATNVSMARAHARKCNILIFRSRCVLKNWLRLAVRAITGKFTFYDSFVTKQSALRLFCNLLSNLHSCIFVYF